LAYCKRASGSYDCGPAPAYPSISQNMPLSRPFALRRVGHASRDGCCVRELVIRRESFQSVTRVATALSGWGPRSQPCQAKSGHPLNSRSQLRDPTGLLPRELRGRGTVPREKQVGCGILILRYRMTKVLRKKNGGRFDDVRHW
jgi:hypothetical protein